LLLGVGHILARRLQVQEIAKHRDRGQTAIGLAGHAAIAVAGIARPAAATAVAIAITTVAAAAVTIPTAAADTTTARPAIAIPRSTATAAVATTAAAIAASAATAAVRATGITARTAIHRSPIAKTLRAFAAHRLVVIDGLVRQLLSIASLIELGKTRGSVEHQSERGNERATRDAKTARHRMAPHRWNYRVR
jgi:hypothetical protein